MTPYKEIVLMLQFDLQLCDQLFRHYRLNWARLKNQLKYDIKWHILLMLLLAPSTKTARQEKIATLSIVMKRLIYY